MILQIIDVLIGLTVVYLIFSTVASALFDLVEAILKKRGEMLERGIGEIFSRIVTAEGGKPTRDRQDLLAEFYNSPHIYSLFEKAYRPKGCNLPSYIPAERFAGAIMTLARNGEQKEDFTRIVNTILAVSGVDLGELGKQVERDVEQTRAQLIAYFDTSMERVSGWYARHARAWLLGIGLVVAALFNVDTLQLIRQLSQDDALRENIVSQVLANKDRLDPQTARAADDDDAGASTADPGLTAARSAVEGQLQLVDTLGLPIGWRREDLQRMGSDAGAFVIKLLGLILTAFALSFGAPLWFGLLSQLASLRSSLRPGDKRRDEAADDNAASASSNAAPQVRIELAGPPAAAVLVPAAGAGKETPTKPAGN